MRANRQYSMSLRDEQVLLARRRILDEAGRLIAERGYGATKLAEVAAAAEVSVQTVYNVVGNKAAVLKAVYDVTMAGDDEPVPIAQRPMMRAVIDATDGRSCLAGYAAMSRVLGERALPLVVRLLAQAAAGDADVLEFATTIERERGVGTRSLATHIDDRFGLKEGLDVQAAADVLWTLTAPDITDRLVNQRDWGWDRYERWLGETMADAVLTDGGR